MPIWFFIALGAPAIFAMGNYYDKFLLGRYGRHITPTVLIVFTGFFGALVSPLIGIFHPAAFAISPRDALIVMGSGVFFLTGLIPYINALDGEEATAVVPFFQLMPVIYLLLGWLILHETLTGHQLLGGAIVLLGAIVLSVDIERGKTYKVNLRSIGLVLLASLLLALGSTTFKFVASANDFWTANFWDYLGEFLTATFIFLAFPKIRKMAAGVVRREGAGFLVTNGVNDGLTLAGSLLVSFAMLLGPVALVSLVNGFQPIFLLIYGIAWSRLFPQYGVERLNGGILLRKLLAVLIMFAGVAFISLG